MDRALVIGLGLVLCVGAIVGVSIDRHVKDNEMNAWSAEWQAWEAVHPMVCHSEGGYTTCKWRDYTWIDGKRVAISK